ncbi:hypothetical protein [Lederbergia citri]|uniref:Uncharacterized protein n=1 Tax=Lederbergia citri TaxID=2833580 RepID=A0A942YGM1_9BACI|nr:hypothetical protein [Lederbergia citri]MBS4194839.1 hypothetical protein [Lederbergia citri]
MINSVLKKQSGYALILVLLIITILAVIATPIISKILSGSLQYKKAEQHIQIDNLREMGIIYMESVVNQAINDIETVQVKPDNLVEYKERLTSKINPENQISKKFKEEGYQFQLKVNSIDIDDEENAIIIRYQVTPSLKNTFDDINTSYEVIHLTKDSEK